MATRAITVAAGLVLALAARARPAAAAPGSEAPPEAEAPDAPAVPAPAPPPDPLHVYAMTMGPGNHPFFRFGHNAIWIRDVAAGTDRVYNFGTFRFDSPRLIFDFLGGRLNYWLSVSALTRVIGEYTHENRSVAVQELQLTPEQECVLQA